MSMRRAHDLSEISGTAEDGLRLWVLRRGDVLIFVCRAGVYRLQRFVFRGASVSGPSESAPNGIKFADLRRNGLGGPRQPDA